jgi:succinoglycan biosynthesis transport protein ExoP
MQRSETADPFDLVRATIEADVAAPGVVVVSSALDGDGKTGVAFGLVRSLAAAGYRTLAIDTAANSPRATSLEAAAVMFKEMKQPVPSECDAIAIAAEHARTASATAIAAFYAAIRGRYDYAVVDAAIIGAGGLAFARGADGVVLALREGRSVSPADKDAVDLFERLRVRFLGVVATREDGRRHRAAAAARASRLQTRRRALPAIPVETVRGLVRFFSRSPI